MKFVSTRGQVLPVSLSSAIDQGLAADGGLFVSERWPRIEVSKFDTLQFSDFAEKLFLPFFEGDLLEAKLHSICQRAFDFPIPLKEIDSDTYLLELFHGPTAAFKDFGARFLALCVQELPPLAEKQRMVMVATSGDTGGAVASAFCTLTDIPVSILYPLGRISLRQEKQLTCWGDKVKAFAVKGTFDDCQKLVKEAFLKQSWKTKYQLISANSINLARLFPQMAYFAFTAVRFYKTKMKKPVFIVPSGNVGNATAALWALHLGFPIEKVVFAHNENKSVPNYFQSGQWKSLPTIQTLANAMDVGNPSNFERILNLYPQLHDLKNISSAYSVSDLQIQATIQKTMAESGEILCPHTATAMFARQFEKGLPAILLATAHPAKFETIVEPLIGKAVSVPRSLMDLMEKPSQFQEINPQIQEMEKILGL